MTADADGGRPAAGGPLAGVKVVEMAGLGPVPFAGMVLADLGADVVRIERTQGNPLVGDGVDFTLRHRRNVALDVSTAEGRALALKAIERSDVVIEGFRPGVMERFGLGPDVCLAANPRLVYVRVTGWGQDGPLAHTAGHDLDFIARTGALWSMGRADGPPVPPLNLLGDYGGGAMFAVVGTLGALLEVRASGRGQVVDAAIVDGSVLLTSLIWAMLANHTWQDRRGANVLDGAAPFYDVYACADGEFLAVAAIEPMFYAELVARTGYPDEAGDQWDTARWPEQKRAWAAHLATRTRDEWMNDLEGTDACASPVLRWADAPDDPHLRARGVLVDVDGLTQTAPAPRFSRSVTRTPAAPPRLGEHTDEVLRELGCDREDVARLRATGVAAGVR